MRVHRSGIIAVALFGAVTTLEIATLRAQGNIRLADNSISVSKNSIDRTVCPPRFQGGGPGPSGSLTIPREASKFESAKRFESVPENRMPTGGVVQMAERPCATNTAIGDELAEAPAALSVQSSSHVQSRAEYQTGSVSGTVLDVNGNPVPGAEVTLTDTTALRQRIETIGASGEFAFTRVPPGTYFIIVHAEGFEPYISAKFSILAGQAYEMPSVQMSLPIERQVIVVRPTSVIAQMQMKAEERQRVLSVFPNIYTSYVWNAAPLDAKQKFSLSARDIFNPTSLLGVAAAAGVEQETNTFTKYGQGVTGYGKRFGAEFANLAISDLVSGAVFPSLFHQDPRFFYQGSGSFTSRLLHALSWSVMARSDKGREVPNISNMLGDLTAGALSNLYYPRADRGASLVLANFALGLAGRAVEGVMQEFLLKRLTKPVPRIGKP